MSSASNRPFRHTATVVSLAIVSALCDVGKDLVENTAMTLRQSESEAKKARVNKGRVAALEKKAKESGQRQEILDGFIKDWFDTVFVHRYRDVDPKIRVECVEALSEWIMTYPDLFFDGHHLRYLGWVLSDTHAPTRHEVVKQLQKLFRDKDKLGGLKTFTERFRARIVEMATRDAEATVRAASVELLDILREAGLLEPDDIDSVGRLIFDSEPRVRKAVVGFFAENINGTYENQIDEMGGQEVLQEALVTVENNDNDSPRLEWLKLKCLVEQLAIYDSEEAELPSQIEQIPGSHFTLIAAGIESRFSLAAQALYDYIPEIRQWEVLAGYLLFDHSQTTQNGSTEDVDMMLQQNCRLTEREEIILLEILNATVKLRLTHASESDKDKKTKKTKAQKRELLETQEEAASHLAVLIPRLLKKFGALPDAASSVLNLERVLNLDVFQELRQDSTLAALLDDINKQFLTHGNERVLMEASEALRHAQSYEELKEITEGRVQALWDETMNAFNTLKKGRDLTTRGSLSANVLTGVSNTVLRIANLASISDCTEILETAPAAPPISALIDLIGRGVPAADLDPETDAQEDVLTSTTFRALLPYFMWKVSHWATHLQAGTAIPDADVTAVAERRDACIIALTQVMEERRAADDLRLDAACLLLDLYNMFPALRTARARASAKQARGSRGAGDDDWEALEQEVDAPVQRLLLSILGAAEKAFAKRADKTLEAGDVDDEPVDPDEEPESESEDEADDMDEAAREEKQHRALIAEQRLCELGSRIVMGVAAGVLDGKEGKKGEIGPVRKRLERNRARLGQNWKEVVAHLDVAKKEKTKGGVKAKAKAKQPQGKAGSKEKSTKSEEIIIEDDEDDEEERGEEDEGEGEGELRARGLVVEDEIEDEENEVVPAPTDEVESVLGD